MLILISTPIGNLSDITFRAIEELRSCDLILCEDTRHSQKLLNHYDIHQTLKSLHKFNEAEQITTILEELRSGKKICLISDAGTPGISDPGERLVSRCVAENLPITAIPGPCALIQALVCSGLPTQRFQFLGFLPRKEGELKTLLQEINSYPGTTICYESPHRLKQVLETIHDLLPQRQLVIARELTKKFEQWLRGTAQELITQCEAISWKGEYVLLFSPASKEENPDWSAWSVEEHLLWVQKTFELSQRDAIKVVAEIRGVPKRDVYKQTL